MNKDFAVLFMVRATELPKDYKSIIDDCKSKTTQYFGTRNIEDQNDAPGLHIECEITKEDVEELRTMFPNYVELAFVEKADDKFVIVDL